MKKLIWFLALTGFVAVCLLKIEGNVFADRGPRLAVELGSPPVAIPAIAQDETH